ncbi:MAG TPA: TetR/AcrR family transcriptional regulator [Casimicrobiaceae bacterium]|nr:TetR/AcrR family transcriptional regulator [Casimicrobiaceae bacterium]
MAQRKPPRRTRERILETALALFNREGEPNVTTGDIADELNISPGNLYYHFRNKDDIIGDLYAALDAKITPLTAVPPDRLPSADDLWLLLHLLFERMWEYRFFYRDVDEITSRNRKIAQGFADFNRRGEATVIQLCRGMVHAGAMRASDREIVAVAQNILMVATYWMSWQRVSGRSPTHDNHAAKTENRLAQAAHQVMALIAPYLQGEARALIDQLGTEYLDASA